MNKYYDENATKFFDATVDLNMAHLYQPFLAHVRPGGRILDAGCGSGRDTKRFKELGFDVLAFDGSQEMVRLALAYTGITDVLHLHFDQIDFNQEFDGIWACASLLHIPRTDLPNVLRKLHRALKTSGIAYVSFKHGHHEGVRNGRHFTDLDEAQLSTLANESGFAVSKSWITSDARPGRSDEHWLNALLVSSV